jgi:hypothetical protein
MSDLTDDETEERLPETKEPIPEADALEQAEPVVEEQAGTNQAPAPLPDHLPDDAPEADALEQATPVPGQDEEDAPR